MTARVRLVEGLSFEAEAGSGHHLRLDTAPEHGGHDAGFRPMELLLIGLVGCSGMDVLSILRKQRQQVISYELVVEGIRSATHPKVFVEIRVEHLLTGRALQAEAVARALELSVQRYCGAEAMLNKVARITHTLRLLDVDTGREITAEVAPSKSTTAQ
ncbi:MAG: OsmC family protein [Thermogemmatispora sp.]|nr:OsmC family protein [Thermogemmatispora sp.]